MMVSYNVNYELASVGFLALLIVLIHRKRTLPTLENRIFKYILYSVWIAGCFSALFGYVEERDFSITVKSTACILGNIAAITALVCYGRYVMSLVHHRRGKVLRLVMHAVIPTLCMIIIATSPLTKLYFYYNDKGEFCAGSLRLFVTIYFAIYMVAISVYIIKFSYNMYSGHAALVTVINIVLLCSYLIPFIMKNHPCRPIFVSTCLCMYILYIVVQNPDYYIDIRTHKFNMDGFQHMLKERIDYRKPTSCFIIRVKNYTSMSRLYEYDSLQKIQYYTAEIIEEECGKNTAYHVGSSTFAVIKDNEEQVEEIYNKLIKKMPSQWVVNRELIMHDYSYYKVSYPQDSEDYEEIMQRIHYARSDHKGHHKTGELIHLHDEALAAVAKRRMTAHMIEKAIMYNTLEINFQPIVSLEKKKITSLEVLSRLKDDEHKYINPEYFIHVAEENHTIEQLSIQMYRKACDFAVRNDIFNCGVEDININLSPIHCHDNKLAGQLCEIAEEYNIPMNRFHFEITESELTNEKNVRNTLAKLKEAGAKIALDDFGTGFSNVTSITHLPIDYVKIDKSLVWSYARGENELLNELMPMIKAEGKMIIAEGIETDEHIERLERMCGDFLQGYYYSKPLPEDQFMRYLKTFNEVE